MHFKRSWIQLESPTTSNVHPLSQYFFIEIADQIQNSEKEMTEESAKTYTDEKVE